MKATLNLILKGVLTVMVSLTITSVPVWAQETQSSDKIQQEMEEMLGTSLDFMSQVPEHLQELAWEMMKARQNPEAALSAKNAELVSLGVASQIPCNYCVYYHTQMAKLLGASEGEIKEAVENAANTRYWSTVLNGTGADYQAFKEDIDQVVAHLQEQAATSQNPESNQEQ